MMGNFVRPLSEGVSLIASDETWIEDKAIQQLQLTAALPGMVRVVGMPDLHPGRGTPVGAAFFSTGRFYPALVGNDIGCGMGLWQTDLGVAKVKLDKLEKRLGSLDSAVDDDDGAADRETGIDVSQTGFSHALGTIGGGNHFAELQQVDNIFDEEAAKVIGLNKKNFVLLVHSGSRGLGEKILRDHVARFGDKGLAEDTVEANDYLAQHDEALEFAALNRKMIAARFLGRIGAEGERILDLFHNLVSPAAIDSQAGWLHRKGAAPSDQGMSIVPGSRGDYSYLVKPIAPSSDSLFSLAHGAGRKWMRSDCKGRLSARYTLAQLSRTRLGSRVVCDDRQLIYEEAPEAYKSVDTVIDALSGAGLVALVACLKPVLTYKTRAEDRS